MDWAYPMFCDVTVRLQEADIHGKMDVRGADGFHLGYDKRRRCHFAFIPAQNRLGSFTVLNWRPESFEQCQGITFDTPVNYRHDGGDLTMGPSTLKKVKLRRHASKTQLERAAVRGRSAESQAPPPSPAPTPPSPAPPTEAERAVLRINAAHITAEVDRLKKEGVSAFKASAVEDMVEDTGDPDDRPLVYGRAATLGTFDRGQTVEIEIVARTERAREVLVNEGIMDIKTVDQMMKSKWWPIFKENMEEEIAGKLKNKAFSVVRRPAGVNVMKSKWAVQIKLNDDGSLRKVKTRLVGCGYSQIEGKDYDKCYASTPPAFSLRFWISCVCDEGLWTDHIDAVKAFTQADIDRLLYCEMADGFAIPGYVLLLHKALEGIKQGAYLWFQKNKWAWNKVGLTAKLTEPNVYTHPTLGVITVVFADDCGAAYPPEHRAEYLAMRAEYGRLINIDSPGPDMTVPVTMLTGIDVAFDYDTRTAAISQRTYIGGLEKKYKNMVTMNDMPTPPSKAKREAFEEMEKGTEETCVDQALYLERLGQTGWVTVISCPEGSFYQSTLASHMKYPTRENHNALLYYMGYIINNRESTIVLGGRLKIPLGLSNMPEYFEESYGLYVVHDSSWGKKPKPHSGHAVMRCNAAIYWSSKALKVVCDSTAHAESAEMARALKSTTFARMLHEDSKREVKGPSYSLGDNSACHQLVQKEGSSQATRHFERAIAAIKYAVMMLIIRPMLVPTEQMIADVFTKATDEKTFHRCKHELRNTGRGARETRKISKMRAVLSRMGGA